MKRLAVVRMYDELELELKGRTGEISMIKAIKEAHHCPNCGSHYSTRECRRPAPESEMDIQGRCECGEYYELEHEQCDLY